MSGKRSNGAHSQSRLRPKFDISQLPVGGAWFRVCLTALADLLGDHADVHQQGKGLAAQAEAEHGLERGGNDQKAEHHVGSSRPTQPQRQYPPRIWRTRRRCLARSALADQSPAVRPGSRAPPPATRRADTSFTGFGKEKIRWTFKLSRTAPGSEMCAR